jgi:hypothetical protein
MATVKNLSRVAVPKTQAGVKTAVSQQTAKPRTTPVRTAPTPVPQPVLSKPQPMQRPVPQPVLSKPQPMQRPVPQPVKRPATLPPVVQQRAKQALAQSRPIQQTMPQGLTAPQPRTQQPMVPPAMMPPTIGIDKRMPVINDQSIQPSLPSLGQTVLGQIGLRVAQQPNTPQLPSAEIGTPGMAPPVESVPTDPVTGRQVTPEDYQKMMEKFFPPGTTPPVAMPTPPPLEGFYASDEYKSYKNPYEVPGRPGYSMAPAVMEYDPIFGDVSAGGGPGGAQYIDYLMRTNQQFGAGLNEYDKSRMQLNPDYLSSFFGGNQFDKQQQLNQMLQQYQQKQQTAPGQMSNMLPPASTTLPIAQPPANDFYNSEEYTSYKNPYPNSSPDMMFYDPVFGDNPSTALPGGDQYINYLMRTKQQFGSGLNEYDKGRMQLEPNLLSNYFGQFNDFDRQRQLNQMLQQYQQPQQQPAVQAISSQPRIF